MLTLAALIVAGYIVAYVAFGLTIAFANCIARAPVHKR